MTKIKYKWNVSTANLIGSTHSSLSLDYTLALLERDDWEIFQIFHVKDYEVKILSRKVVEDNK